VVYIYTTHITERIQYIVDTLFGDKALLTNIKENVLQHKGLKINYSFEPFDDEAFSISPAGLLFEEGIRQQNIACFEWDHLKAFFKTEGDIPFDIFAASFYLITRYEEYLPHQLDEYGRYGHTNSMAYKENFLQLPLVNLWLQALKKKLIEKRQRVVGPIVDLSNSLPAPAFTFLPTYDVDIAYSYLHQPLWKNILGFYRDLLKGNFDKVLERAEVYSGRKKDPFDEFDWMDSLHEAYQLRPIFFLLTIIKRGRYDKNISASAKAIRKLYNRLATKYKIGIHPSWQSGTDKALLAKEMGLLQKIVGQPITCSRNHYLRFTVPQTYRRLIAAGIREEYSMAYGSINGFRASYTLPHRWYDLEKETVTLLRVHPFCFMEASSFFEQKYTAQQAAEEIQYYHDIVKSVNGEFITLFHNHFLTQQPQWLPWREMYMAFLKKNFSR